jgi:transketolase
MPAFKSKIAVASPVTTDDLAEAELSVMQRQKVEAAFELRLKTHKQQEIEYKQYFKQMIHDYERQFEQRNQELERQFDQRLKEGVNKYIDEWQREMRE